MRGRKPKPQELAELHGNPRDRPTPIGAKAAPVEVLPEPPPVLDDVAAAMFRELVASTTSIGMLTNHDLAALTTYCAAWSQFCTAEKKLQEEDYVITDAKGNPIRNPWYYIKNSAVDQLMKIGVEFGFTPSSRTRVNAVLPPGGKKPRAAIDGHSEKTLDDFIDSHPGV